MYQENVKMLVKHLKITKHYLFSGFLIVAACVMTFEARDSATKIVPTAAATQKEQVFLFVKDICSM